MFRKIPFVKIPYERPTIQNNIFRWLSSKENEINSIKKIDDNENKKQLTDDNDKKKPFFMGYIEKIKGSKENKQEEERKGPFKNYYSYEERDKNKIMRYEEFIDRNTKKKDKENFIVRIFFYTYFFIFSAFKIT